MDIIIIVLSFLIGIVARLGVREITKQRQIKIIFKKVETLIEFFKTNESLLKGLEDLNLKSLDRNGIGIELIICDCTIEFKNSIELRRKLSELILNLEENILDCKFKYGDKNISLEVSQNLQELKMRLRKIMWENNEDWATD